MARTPPVPKARCRSKPATFAQYAVNADPSAPLSPYNPKDAIYTAARMLCANGADTGTDAGIRQAIYAYNHAGWYVDEVLQYAAKYAAPPLGRPDQPDSGAGDRVRREVREPCTGGERPLLTHTYCSGLVYAAYRSAGITTAAPPTSGARTAPQCPLPSFSPVTCCSTPGP